MATLYVARNPITHTNVYIEYAQRKIPYQCIDCESRVIARMGSKRVFHFAHKSKSSCKGETSTHMYCKHLLQQNLCKIKFTSRCMKCNQTQHKQFQNPLRTAQEHPWNSYKIDVAVLNDTEMVGALEVYHSHRTSRTKMGDLIRNGVFVTDVETTEILSKLTIDSDEYLLDGTHICTDCYRSREQQRIKNLERTQCVCDVCDKVFHCTRLFGRSICSRDCFEHNRVQRWTTYHTTLFRLHEHHKQRQLQQKWTAYRHVLMNLHRKRVQTIVKRWTSYQDTLMNLHKKRVQQERQTVKRWNSYQRVLMTLHRKRVQQINSIISRWNSYQHVLMTLHKKRENTPPCMQCGSRNVSIILDDYLFLCSTECYQQRLQGIFQKQLT